MGDKPGSEEIDEEICDENPGEGFLSLTMKAKMMVFGGLLVLLIVVSVVPSVLYLAHPVESERERFGIYLLSSGELVISEDDIVYYNQTSREIVLGDTGLARIEELGTIPVNGTGFVVMVDGQVIFKGAFWTTISSIPYNGVVIIIDFMTQNTLKFELGYPTSHFFEDTDPRDDPRITNIFSSLGRLIH